MKHDIKKIVSSVIYEEAVSILKDLVRIKTVNPPGNEKALAPIIEKAFASIGAEMQIWEKESGRANFIGKIGHDHPVIGFFPHLDTVPAGDGWKTDPFTPVVRDGKLYARGAVDSKGNFAASWAAIKTFLERQRDFQGTVYLVGCADEEMGSDNGVKYLLQKGLQVDYAIVPDGGYIDKIIIGEKGIIRLQIKSFGKQAHGSSPDQGINAVEHLIKFLSQIAELSFEELSFHEQFSGITKNIGVITGGHAANIVPAYAEAEIDIRFPVGIEKEEIMRKIQEKERLFRKKEKTAQISIEETLVTPAHITEEKSFLINAFLKSAKDLAIPMRVGTMGGVTDAKSLALSGIETLVHCLDDGSHSAHNANEYVKLENIRTAAALYTLTLENIFSSYNNSH